MANSYLGLMFLLVLVSHVCDEGDDVCLGELVFQITVLVVVEGLLDKVLGAKEGLGGSELLPVGVHFQMIRQYGANNDLYFS